jgi:nucleoside-diphosphate-sugar epimerase
MTLLVTGASGHVGFEIAKQAAQRGLRVLALYRDGFRADESHALGSNVAWVQCDLNDASVVRTITGQQPIGACVHAAAISNEAFARPNPLDAINTNIGATANLLDAARTQGWRRFVFVSSGSVFQKRADTASPIPEHAQPEPANIYSTTKYSGEMLTRMYRTEFGLSASTVRISWVFGPPIISDSPTRGPIPSYIMRALRGEAIREGGGDFTASFTFIDDVAAGLIAAATAAELRHDTYHLGHGVNFTARQAADAVRKACPGAVIELGGGTEPWTKFTAIRGPLTGTRFRDDTGFTPKHTLDTAVKAYADWMRANARA